MSATVPITAIVDRAIVRVNEVLLPENALLNDPQTILLGDGASLDSMGFVNFVVALEDEYHAAIGDSLNLVERLNDSNGTGPGVRTLGDLIQFLAAAG